MSFSLGGAARALESLGAVQALKGLALDPFKAYSFRVVLGMNPLGGFNSISGVGWRTEVRTVREGGVNDYEHKLPGQSTCNELVFRKGLTLSDPMWRWYSQTISGRVWRMNGTIILMSDLHRPSPIDIMGTKISGLPAIGMPVAAWSFYGAWPIALEGAQLDASQSMIAVQQMTLAIDRIEKTIDARSLFNAAKSVASHLF
ncbi:phage tail protein [Trinickia caryophylli]|uniref:Conserved hypothetical phage tail region protein n=1 Tax=Trinickia caryophylli TaxID=28094 RepID=A0A1X7GA54_TRICW|nr:phage tail protein [Trinickia caryophylli]PMS11359.1 hypothetical protein C0Z17_14530 [Trinickia caryophylli]TRX17551.1 phage tail protein [Trinickia caryophylli]WQE11700.1 phage tail protein [Trinickia caryophylli]SMF66589.1 conserved hypothetical phage tail region protein [Trinickia caryophylli]GLU34885.1 hypothetical protein Busp01_47270 [Trinickia caryophylli]